MLPTKECATSCPYRLALMKISYIADTVEDDFEAVIEIRGVCHDILFGKSAPKFEDGFGLGEK